MQRDYSNATGIEQKLRENVRVVRDRIGEACTRVHRDPKTVGLVAVTKTMGLDVVRSLLRMGLTDLGENRVHRLVERAEAIGRDMGRSKPPEWIPEPLRANQPTPPRWHMIGNLQRNKVRSLLPWVSMIHSVDRLRLAEEIDHRAAELSRRVDVLLEVSGADEPQKGGAAVCAAAHLGEQMASLPHLRLRGLMAMAPQGEDANRLGNVFSRVSELFEEMRHDYAVGEDFDLLSMGMSNDFEIAVACGSNLVRVGTALFEGIPPSDRAASNGAM